MKVSTAIKFPYYGFTHLSHEVTEPQNGRVLIVIRGWSGKSVVSKLLITAPEDSISRVSEKLNIYQLLAGKYTIKEGVDKKGAPILRFYPCQDEGSLYLFGVSGFLKEGKAQEVARVWGRSRSGAQGSRWSLIAAPEGAEILVEDYPDEEITYIVKGGELIKITASGLLPSEW